MQWNNYALIGRHISHSLSPRLHDEVAKAEMREGGAGYRYEMLDLLSEDEIESMLRNTRYRGFNVTSPYKRAVIPYLDELTEEARALDAVNTILRREDGSLIGHNTDVYGFMQMIGSGRVSGRKILVLGSGGAASAVTEGLRRLGAREIVIISRREQKGGDEQVRYATYETMDQHLDAEVIINSTPVGMYPEIHRSPLDGCKTQLADFPNLTLAADLIYNPYRSRFLIDAESLGIPIQSGLRMLIYQGIRASEIWGEFREAAGEDALTEEELATEILLKLLSEQLNIVVVGMPGCGKSSIARRMAIMLGRRFFDNDHEVERRYRKKPSEIILEEGEPKFREIEAEVLADLCKEKGRVIATGGGGVIRSENRDRIRANSVCFYIKRPTEMLSKEGRPLSKSAGTETLYQQRAPLYEAAADITVLNNRRFGATRGANGEMNSYRFDMDRFVGKAIQKWQEYLSDIVHKGGQEEL